MTDKLDAQSNASNHFAWLNARMGIEQAYLAWMRTSIALIGFGFTIVQFFQRLGGHSEGVLSVRYHAPRDFGLALIATGVLTLVMSTWQYMRLVKHLWSEPFKAIAGAADRRVHTPAFFAASVLMLIGVAALVSVFFRFA